MHCRAGRPLPYQAPALQHGGMRGDMREGIEIMRGHEHGERILPHKLFDQGQYLPLSLPVQRGRRFVQEQQFRLLNEGPGESSPLPLGMGGHDAAARDLPVGQPLDEETSFEGPAAFELPPVS